MKRTVTFLTVVMMLCMVLYGCGGSGYTPPMTQYTYITNTQEKYHQLTSVEIVNKNRSLLDIGSMVGLPDFIEYFIDGRTVAFHKTNKNFRTNVQIPPGDHQLIIQMVSRVAHVPRFRDANKIWVWDVSLEEGSTARICGTGEIDCWNYDLYGFSEENMVEVKKFHKNTKRYHK